MHIYSHSPSVHKVCTHVNVTASHLLFLQSYKDTAKDPGRMAQADRHISTTHTCKSYKQVHQTRPRKEKKILLAHIVRDFLLDLTILERCLNNFCVIKRKFSAVNNED